MADNIGTAYVQIEPSFEGVTPKIEQHFGGEGEKSGKSFASGFGSVIGTVGKAMAGAAAAGTAAVTGMVKEAVSGFADYEQLVGGVETLFGSNYKTVEEYAKGVGVSMDFAADTFEDYQNRQETVLKNADNAYMTAGLSANDYMETVTGFAAALNSSLGEYAWQSANYADMAITDMADNANKMGSSMESIQNAYMGFSKQNFTMLDNLKLGYGGTKEEMQRLLTDAEKLEGLKVGSLDMNNFADVVDAIHIIQENLGIAGTTAKEASSTISGSLATMQASWANLLTTIGRGDSDAISTAINNLVESASTFGGNILPVIQQALPGISQLISQLAPEIAAALPDLIAQILPGLLEAGVQIITSLAQGIIQAIPQLMPAITDVILQLCQMLVQMLPELIQVGMQVILELAMGIAQALPELIPTIVETVLTIATYLIENEDLLIDAAIALIMGLAEGLINALPVLVEKAPEIVIKLVDALIRNAPKIMEASISLVFKLIEGIVKYWGKIFEVGAQIIEKIKGGFTSKAAESQKWGRDLIDNFINGIKEKWEHLKQTVGQVAESIKSYLGFSEPEEGPLSNFHTYAPDMMELYAKGITENAGLVRNALTDATSGLMDPSVDVSAVRTIQTNNESVSADSGVSMGRVAALLETFVENFKQDIYLDTGVLVGATAPAYNTALGQIAVRGGNR
jgi:hypothetical protein